MSYQIDPPSTVLTRFVSVIPQPFITSSMLNWINPGLVMIGRSGRFAGDRVSDVGDACGKFVGTSVADDSVAVTAVEFPGREHAVNKQIRITMIDRNFTDGIFLHI